MKKSAISAYQQNKLHGIHEASPVKLVTMLLEEAISCMETAAIACENKDIGIKAKSIRRAMTLIDQGLYSVLDFEKGGAVAATLGQTYQNTLAKLLQANIDNDANAIRFCSGLIKQIREGWTAAEALDK